MRTLILTFLLLALSPLSCTFMVDFDEQGTPEDCLNQIDDDGDGYVDCNDQDCWETPACNNLFEICDNRVDDNGDDAIDCEDFLCASDQACIQDFELCNELMGNEEEIWMYFNVYESSPFSCNDPAMQCRIDYRTGGVPRCVYPELVYNGGTGFPCYNDLECPMGHVCARSEATSIGNEEPGDSVCLPLCSNLISPGCPPHMECFHRMEPIFDDTFGGPVREVKVFNCDTPVCQVLGLDPLACMTEMQTCYPADDMLGQGYCARAGEGGHGMICESDSDCFPKHKCAQSPDGTRKQCFRVCKEPEDCLDIGPVSFECRMTPYWATYGLCITSDVGNL
ncbi:hypothetical protein KJ975_05560 [Myxococcota bacterium]|nr:hypothetical protein [Myxococcota bacterium]